jgi:small-conductance mechanosensitive channel
MLEEAAAHPKTLEKPAPEFYFLEFGESSLDVSLRCYVQNALDIREVASDLRLGILARFRGEGIEIPFPQRVITMVGDDTDDSETLSPN